MPESAVASPTAVTLTRSAPSPALTVPAMTRSPGPFSTGADSPVIMASFSDVLPSVTSPSAGTPPPGRTNTRSPTANAAAGTVSTPSGVRRSAVSGNRWASASSAPDA